MWRIQQRKTVPTRHGVLLIDMFLGCFQEGHKMTKLHFLIGVLVCIHILRVAIVSFPGDQFLRDLVNLMQQNPFLSPGFTAKALGKFNNIFEVLRLARAFHNQP